MVSAPLGVSSSTAATPLITARSNATLRSSPKSVRNRAAAAPGSGSPNRTVRMPGAGGGELEAVRQQVLAQRVEVVGAHGPRGKGPALLDRPADAACGGRPPAFLRVDDGDELEVGLSQRDDHVGGADARVAPALECAQPIRGFEPAGGVGKVPHRDEHVIRGDAWTFGHSFTAFSS